MPRCRKHNQPERKTCVGCHADTVTREEVLNSVRAEEDRKIMLAHRLAMFLGVNDVENYTSPSGYKMKIVTIRKPASAIAPPWHQSKEDAA